MRRRSLLLLAFSAGCGKRTADPEWITVRLQVLLGPGADKPRFDAMQAAADRHFEHSGLRFDVRTIEKAYLRLQGNARIADTFLAPDRINVFVTASLPYDLDRQRTGGASVGPYARGPMFPGNRYYQTFLGLADAGANTLEHEYAHHLTLDTSQAAGPAGNFWSDLRNDYWLWRQRSGASIEAFRRCQATPFAVREPRNGAPVP